MKFRCERDALGEALASAGRAISTRGGLLPMLSGVKLELTADDVLTVTGSDLDLTISVSTPVSASATGVAVLPSKLVSDVVRSLIPGAVTLEVVTGEAKITGGAAEFLIRVIPAEDFPQLPDPDVDAVTVNGRALREALRQVVPAASTDEARPILTGVQMVAEENGVRLVATDSYRLSLRDLSETSVLAPDQKALIPSRALAELQRIIGDSSEVGVRLGQTEVVFEVAATRLRSRLIEGDFPNYRGLIPTDHPNRLLVAREALIEALRRVRLLAQESSPVRLEMSSSGLQLVAVTADVGRATESVDAHYDGTDLTVAFNPEFLLKGIEVTPGEEVMLETVDELKPALLRPVATSDADSPDDFLYLLMPVRVT